MRPTCCMRQSITLPKWASRAKAPSVDWNQMKAYKDEVIGQNTGGIEFLFKKNKIDWLKGWASIPAAGKVQGR